MSGSRTRAGRRVQGDMGEVTTQGDNATESMNQARLPRQVYDPNTEPDRPCLLARTLQGFSPRKRMEVARSCTFCTPARSDEPRPELVLGRCQGTSPAFRRKLRVRSTSGLSPSDHGEGVICNWQDHHASVQFAGADETQLLQGECTSQ